MRRAEYFHFGKDLQGVDIIDPSQQGEDPKRDQLVSSSQAKSKPAS